jgi:hypothetical protein
LQVAVVGPNDRIELKNIRAGVDLGTEIEVVDGLRPGERVVYSPPAPQFQGELVRVETQAQPASGTKAASEPEGK